MYVVIVGSGDIGASLIENATTGDNDVVVIEYDEKQAEMTAKRQECIVYNDDPTEKATLRNAGVDRADVLISATKQDATNILVCLLARELGVTTIVSIVRNVEYTRAFHQIGVSIIEDPKNLSAEFF